MNDVYYLVVSEWLYPTDSGREVESLTFDTQKEALDACKKMCQKELPNYQQVCGDALPPCHFLDSDNDEGWCITAKNGLDNWEYSCRVIPVKWKVH